MKRPRLVGHFPMLCLMVAGCISGAPGEPAADPSFPEDFIVRPAEAPDGLQRPPREGEALLYYERNYWDENPAWHTSDKYGVLYDDADSGYWFEIIASDAGTERGAEARRDHFCQNDHAFAIIVSGQFTSDFYVVDGDNAPIDEKGQTTADRLIQIIRARVGGSLAFC